MVCNSLYTLLDCICFHFVEEICSFVLESHWSVPLFSCIVIVWLLYRVAVVQLLSCVQLFATPWTAACQASLSLTISRIYPSLCSLHQWCSPAISYSEENFSFCPQSFPASGTFPLGVWSHQMAQTLEFQLQHQSFRWIFRVSLP